MRVLIYGATGYLGGAIVRRLVGEHDVVGFARRADAADDLRTLGADAVVGDLDDISAAVAHVDAADAVIYAAQLLIQPEFDVVEAVIERMAGSGKTLVFTSGTGVLSERTDGDWSENTFAEDDEFVPSKYVGARKDTEDLVRAAAERGVRAMVVRPGMIWGHGGCPMIRGLFRSAEATGAVCYIGRGLNLYSNVHVDDVAEVYSLALDKGVAGALYHAVSGETNYRTLAEAVAAKLAVSTRSVDLGTALEFWDKFTALIAFSVCSRSRAPRTRRELGWMPSPDRLDILDDIDELVARRTTVRG